MKRIVTMQDISCVGKCSLTVALPILSVMAVETAVVPTALLSAHSVFPDFTFQDLTDEILPIVRHWQDQKLTFDAIYTGYLGSQEQIDVIADAMDVLAGPETLIFVDPAMADQGRLYAGFDHAFAYKMAELCKHADFIDPNVTEACFLTDTPYRETCDEAYIDLLLEKLKALCSGTVVLTGVHRNAGETGIVGLSPVGERFEYFHKTIPGQFHGTGDVFSSVAVGALMRGLSMPDAFRLAADFTYECIRCTESDPEKRWYGVSFERALPYLIERLANFT